MTKLKELLAELKARNVRKTMAIYVGSALTTIGIIKLFAETYGLSTSFMPIVVTVLTCGLVSAFVFAWFHGKEGAQRFSRREILLHAGIAIVALLLSLRIGPASTQRSLPKGANTIAVLPFKNMSDNKEDEFFSDGITEDILTQLAKIHDLNVISRTSVMKYKNVERNVREVAEELGATAVLEGSVRRVGDRVRITGQLIAANEDRHLWAETYDRELKDIFAIQTDVAQTIARALRTQLSPQEEKLIAKTPTQNLEAYAFYLRGRDHYYRYKKEDNETAITFFKNALHLDANYALAYAGLGDAYCQRYQKFQFPLDWIDSAIVVSKRSVQIDPTLAEGYKALGLAFDAKGWYEKALAHYYAAVRFNPNLASAVGNIGILQQSFGNLDEALKWLKRSITLSPDRAHTYIAVGIVYQALASDSLAFAWYDKAERLEPGNPLVQINRGWLHLTRGELNLARAIAQRVEKTAPDWDIRLDYAADVEIFSKNFGAAKTIYETLVVNNFAGGNYQLVYVLQKLGKAEQANALTTRLLNEYKTQPVSEFSSFTMLEIGVLHAMRADIADANTWIRKAYQKGWRDYRWLQVDPRLENLHKSPAFQELMIEMKARVDEMKTRILSEGL
jgi:TolB-like protein/Tfp pilus assembly protein PilF